MIRIIAAGFAAFALGACASFEPEPAFDLPEAATGRAEIAKGGRGADWAAVAANPHAVKAAADILAAGGSATDAGIAAQLVLNLVEPQSSGLGGGAFALVHDPARGETIAWDGRETAPAGAEPDMFLTADGEPENSVAAAVGGRSIATPSLARLLGDMHARHGRLDWAALFQPAIALAEEGFAVSPRLHRLIAFDQERLASREAAAAYLLTPEGEPKPVDAVITNPAFAAVLRTLAEDGPDAFYEGDIPADIVAAASSDPKPGALRLSDFSAYETVMREPVCGAYRDRTVCGMGPPSSAATTTIAALKLLERHDLSAMAPLTPAFEHLFVEALNVAYADRNAYIADPAFYDPPVAGLIEEGYLDTRAALIDPDAAGGVYEAGAPPGSERAGENASGEQPGTTHISVVDADGQVFSMTSTIMAAFGSRVMARGMFLNNEMTNFSFLAEDEDGPVANRIEPGKRPLSAMAPTIVFGPDGAPELVLGSPGGPAIIAYVTRAIVAMVDFGLSPDEAAALPHVLGANLGAAFLEAETEAAALEPALAEMGHRVIVRDLNSGLHILRLGPDGLEGGADPRREGAVVAN